MVVHIFTEKCRTFYDLDGFYSMAEVTSLSPLLLFSASFEALLMLPRLNPIVSCICQSREGLQACMAASESFVIHLQAVDLPFLSQEQLAVPWAKNAKGL